MNCEGREIGAGLMAHLHLSAAEATVVIDERYQPSSLILYIYDHDAARRVRVPGTWCGHPVAVSRIDVTPLS